MRLKLTRRTAWIAASIVAAAGLTVAGAAAKARPKLDPRAFDVRKKAYGKKFSDWTAEWWQWSMSLPTATHPLWETTGEFAEIGQRGPVWFLGGVFINSGVANRTVSVPAGTALFFPVFNSFNVNWGEPPYSTVEEMRGTITNALNAIVPGSLHVIIDGTEVVGVDRMRVASPLFPISVPTDNNYARFGIDMARGVWGWAIADGYWCMLKPLPAGPHVLHFQASQGPPYNFNLDITYNLTVVDAFFPADKK